MDKYNLNRFLEAQLLTYEEAMLELTRGRKDSHWIWYIFPQIKGLGNSESTKLYSIKSLEESKAYLEHPLLGLRLVEACEILLGHGDRPIEEIVKDQVLGKGYTEINGKRFYFEEQPLSNKELEELMNNKDNDMSKITSIQIRQYCDLAKKAELTWAK